MQKICFFRYRFPNQRAPADDDAGLNLVSCSEFVIHRIGGDLLISDNTSLLSLRGLENLETVTGFLDIGTNANLRDLDGLSKLRSVGSFLIVGFNSSLSG